MALTMALDPVTYLRTEWVSAALCTNQTPRSADVCLQLGTADGRAVNFVPRTIREIITSSAERQPVGGQVDGVESGGLTVSCQRQLRQMVRTIVGYVSRGIVCQRDVFHIAFGPTRNQSEA